jgi:SAM-dependent methyltransferase
MRQSTAMHLDERFDDLAASLGGFYRAWVIQLGLEVEYFAALRSAGSAGLTPVELAATCRAASEPTARWCLAAHASDLVEWDGERVRLDDATGTILLDAHRPEYLGGQFFHCVTASLDTEDLVDHLRTGRTVAHRQPRYRRSIDMLARQDVAVFFEEVLAALPDLVADLLTGLDAVDVRCGSGRWLVAVAQRFPACRLVGIEPEEDWSARARQRVRERGLEARVRIEAADSGDLGLDAFDLAYFQHALHELPEPATALAAAWRALRPGGRLLVLGWCLPSRDDLATLHGQVITGVGLDESVHGGRLRTIDEHLALFTAAGLPEPRVIALPSDATLLVSVRPRTAGAGGPPLSP